jgi:hypothetical protein
MRNVADRFVDRIKTHILFLNLKFHRTIQINYQPDATVFQLIYPDVYLQLNMFRPARPRTQHGYHHDTKVKPEAATAVIELLMMGGRTPKTRLAVNKRQDNKLENCCIWLVIYLS